MTLLEWFIFILAVQVVHFLGTWKLYEKAGRKPWEAAVPIYNGVVLMQIIGRPRWWVLLLFVPIINLIMFPVVWVETLRSFGKTSTTDTLLGVFTLGLYTYYINYAGNVEYRPERELKAQSKSGDTVSSLLFAIVVATLVHTYVMQPFTIPTSSLEKTLLVGDFLFVSKFHYGARPPMTTVAAPMVHDTIPIANIKSYTKWPQLPYFRLPGFETTEKNDIVVFNWPVDTVRFFRDKNSIGIRKPIDKKSNYVKRCVGRPGDTLSIKDGIVYIDGKELILSDRAKPQYSYTVTTDGSLLNDVYLQKQLNISDPYGRMDEKTYLFRALTEENAEKLRNNAGIISVKKNHYTEGDLSIFPHTQSTWSVDNMGPIYIPQEGKTVALNKETLPFYKMIITEYEKNDLKVNGDEIRINGEVVDNYTFKQNYYWMMGDNRHNSEDSRYWGYVPEDHIVGKPVFIWMSVDQNEPWSNFGKKVRWDRMFTTVSGEGEPVSYFKYFIIILVAWFTYDYLRKNKKKAKDN
ncbi:signal peptidase I [Flavobacterium arcticum]|uniref:Signal peptidase I n=1 Tax=Flavobacterium arcticum TaxID=1784713 RepID=A0A345H8B5_9FLAO|nr:signal peptidase I [Flavobacterium arcticum]AXG72825.1 signal peptidase I [Flavobacterium arcticum]KAF2510510.1 signal peptidase I [Flavobacterium arcticum]